MSSSRDADLGANYTMNQPSSPLDREALVLRADKLLPEISRNIELIRAKVIEVEVFLREIEGVLNSAREERKRVALNEGIHGANCNMCWPNKPSFKEESDRNISASDSHMRSSLWSSFKPRADVLKNQVYRMEMKDRIGYAAMLDAELAVGKLAQIIMDETSRVAIVVPPRLEGLSRRNDVPSRPKNIDEQWLRGVIPRLESGATFLAAETLKDFGFKSSGFLGYSKKKSYESS